MFRGPAGALAATNVIPVVSLIFGRQATRGGRRCAVCVVGVSHALKFEVYVAKGREDFEPHPARNMVVESV